MSKVHYLASTGRGGTNVLGLAQAARQMGFIAKGVRGTAETLSELAPPLIAHVVMHERPHYVVVYDVDERRVVFMDPDGGAVRKVSRDDFQKIWSGIALLLAPSEEFRTGDETISPIGRLARLAWPHRAALTQALVGAALYTLLGLSTAIYVQKVVDYVLPAGNASLLNLLSVLMLGAIGLAIFLGVSQEFLVQGVARRIDGQLILGYYDHLLRLPAQFFTSRRVGDVVSRVNDAVKIRAFVSAIALRLVVNVVVVLSSLALTFTYSWKLGCVLLALVPLYAIVLGVTNAINRRNERVLVERSADLQSWLVESIEGISTIKHLRREAYASLQTESRLVHLLRAIDRSARTATFTTGAADALARVAVVAVLWIGGTLALRQDVTTGQLLSVYALLTYLTAPIGVLVSSNRDIHNARIAADRLFETMDLPVDEAEAPGLVGADDLRGDIVFESVSFRYGAGGQVFRSLDLTIPEGQVTAIVGESGSGKSTLLALLHRREQPQGGQIRIGGTDVRHVSADALRAHIGAVPQKVELFSGTVLSNIALGDFEPDTTKLLALSARLGITDFVERLPLRFDTPLGEHGATLSGGQRQRLAIARALYREPPVLMLDEATSALDTSAERRVWSVLDEVRQARRTIIVIAHRLSTVVHADKIIVLRDGAVAEEGTHDELLRQPGEYHRLWAEQFAMSAAQGAERKSLSLAGGAHPTGPAA